MTDDTKRLAITGDGIPIDPPQDVIDWRKDPLALARSSAMRDVYAECRDESREAEVRAPRRSVPVMVSGEWPWQHVVCPVCGHDYVHIAGVRLESRGQRVDCAIGEVPAVSGVEKERYDDVIVVMYCEGEEHRFSLDLRFLTGRVGVEMTKRGFTQEGAVRERERLAYERESRAERDTKRATLRVVDGGKQRGTQ